MAQQEYFVRPPDSENARGPYTLEKLSSLAEAGQVTRDMLYYNDEMEAWASIESNADLMAALFPEKRRLSLRRKTEEEIAPVAPQEPAQPAVTVEQMLAAAEGESEETRHLKEKMRWEDRTATLSLPLLSLVMLISALTLLQPLWSVLEPIIAQRDGTSWLLLLKNPLPIVGAVDLVFSLLLLLAVTSVYPVLRFRMMLGLGFFVFSGYAMFATGSNAGLVLMACSTLFSVGVFTATLSLNFWIVIPSIILALIGVVGYGILSIFPSLLS